MGTPLQTALRNIDFYLYTSYRNLINITDMAGTMKKYGGFIPGIRAGKPTADCG